MDNNASLSLELLLTFMIFIIICSAIFSLVSNQLDMLDETHTRQQAKKVTIELSSIINDVYLNGNSYYQTYYLPDDINDESYVLIINSSGVYINSHYQITRDSIIVKGIYYNDKKSKNIFLMPGNTYTVTNKNGEIYIYG